MIRLSTGVPGLDEMLGGGLPQGHILGIAGPPGSGKTILCLQFIWEGLQRNEKAIFLSLDQEERSLLQAASNFGWDLQRAIDRNMLQLVKLDPADLTAVMGRIESEFPLILREFGAARAVIDPFTILEMLTPDGVERRRRSIQLLRWISAENATALITSERPAESPFLSRFGNIEYAADGFLTLHRFQVDGRAQLGLEIVKMRHTPHSTELKPYSISPKGFVVHTDLKVSYKDLQRRA